MRAWFGLVALVACGRIGFDPAETAGGGGDATGSGSGSDASGTCTPACMAAGGTCMGNDCVIVVTGGGNVTCPPGLTCVINCNTSNACSNGSVTCTMATCTVNCNAGGSCSQETFTCTGGDCTFYCRVDNTCNGNQFGCTSGTCSLECCLTNLSCSGNSGTFPNNGACP